MSKRYEYRINGLSCVHCSDKIEQAISRIPGVDKAILQFATGVLVLYCDQPGLSAQPQSLCEQVHSTASAFENHLLITPKNKAARDECAASGPHLHGKAVSSCDAAGSCDVQPSKSAAPTDGPQDDPQDGVSQKRDCDHQEAHEHDHNQGPCCCMSGKHICNCDECAAHSPADAGDMTAHQEKGYGVLVTIVAATVLFVGALMPFMPVVKLLLFAGSIALSAHESAQKAVKALLRKSVDENVLLCVAVLSAFLIGEYTEAAMVALLFMVGQALEEVAIERSRRSIEKLANIRPDKAHRIEESGRVTINAEDLAIGDVVEVDPYERIPVDGLILQGRSLLDNSALTGESMPAEVEPGDRVQSGSLNGSGLLRMEVTTDYEDSAASRIIRMVQDAAAQKGIRERLVTRFSRIYTSIVMVSALILTVIPTLLGGDLTVWLMRALVFLVAACPCALVISIPLAYFSAIGAASRRGVLVKGGRFVEQLAACRCVAFDKTGTLTTGEPVVVDVQGDGLTPSQVLELAAVAEAHSAHPIAKAVLAAAKAQNLLSKSMHLSSNEMKYSEMAGFGTRLITGKHTILAGSARMMKQHNIDISALPAYTIFIAVDDRAVGAILLRDRLRDNAAVAAEALRNAGVSRLAVLSGDGADAVRAAAMECGIDEYYGELSPEGKVEKIAALKAENAPTAFVGDGINDAPVLAAADIGVAMGLGTDAAIEAADVVLSGSNLTRLPETIGLFRRAMRIIRFNTWFALSIKATVLVLGALGLATMWMAVFADVGVTLLSVLNASRLLVRHRESGDSVALPENPAV